MTLVKHEMFSMTISSFDAVYPGIYQLSAV